MKLLKLFVFSLSFASTSYAMTTIDCHIDRSFANQLPDQIQELSTATARFFIADHNNETGRAEGDVTAKVFTRQRVVTLYINKPVESFYSWAKSDYDTFMKDNNISHEWNYSKDLQVITATSAPLDLGYLLGFESLDVDQFTGPFCAFTNNYSVCFPMSCQVSHK